MGADHGYWGPPEEQTGTRPVKSTSAGSDVCGEAAAALALMYLNYGGSYGQQCLDAAVSILDLGLTNLGRSDGGSFYPSTSHFDDLAWGSIWAAIATGDDSYLDPIEDWMDWEVNDYNDDNYNKEWAPAWDDATVFVLLKLGHLTGNQKFIDGVINNLTWYRDECQRTPYGLPWLDSWGVLRYASAEAGVGYLAYKLLHWDGYIDTAGLTMDYCLGDNPRNGSYVTNYLNNAPQHPHHRANEPNRDGITNGMIGALVGGPNNSDGYQDNVDDYTMNEVAIDYNASYLLGMAGRAWIASGATPAPTATPVPTEVPTPTPIPVYGDVKVQYQAGDANDTTSEPKPRFIIVNDSIEDIPYVELAIRYFMTKDRYREPLILNYDYVQIGSGNLDTTEHEGYIQVAFLSTAGILAAGTTSGEIQLHMSTSPQTQLDQTNDYSFDASYSSGFADYIKVALYRNGLLIWGTDPFGGPTAEPTDDPTPDPTPTSTPDSTPSSLPPTATPTPVTPAYTTGDVNGDGTVDIVDALLVAQYYVGLDPAGFTEPLEAGDTNCDGAVDIVDALLIAQTYVGLDPAAWCG